MIDSRILLLALFSFSAVSGNCVAQIAGGDSPVGYIDSAGVRNQIRIRFDAAYDNPTPDRAEFFYPKCGCFKVAGLDPNAPGPPELESRVDFQEVRIFAESLLYADLISGFVELPFRLINPEQNVNTGGVSDLNVGIKAMLYSDPSQYYTFQLRTVIPTGDGFRGLGIDHTRIEPALLFWRKCCGMVVEGELHDSIPIDGTDGWAGNVLRYGLGVSTTCLDCGPVSVTPVLETVAWSVLSGDVLVDATTPNARIESAETTIVNMKFGTRLSIKSSSCCGGTRSLYVGYGKALTNSRWYDDIIRAEYRLTF